MLKRSSIYLSVLFLMGLLMANSIFAEGLRDRDIKFRSEKMKKDEKGTNTKNIYTFEVDSKVRGRTDGKSYIIVFHLNKKPITQFEGVELPYSFDWNFRAMNAGVYKVKIDIEDMKGALLATQYTTVNVQH